MVGSLVAHFRIIDVLGEGGMGVVYRAEDTRLGRTVALKFLSSAGARIAEARDRLLREARTAAQLDHPNICTIHEVGEHDGSAYIVMALVEGQPLSDLLDAGLMPIADVVRISAQIASALAAAHEQQVVHRDIKPGNLMIDARGQLRILDFGLATAVDSSNLTLVGTTLGTVSYMPPEQARGESVDSRADIWSVGVVMYEMLTGKRPFEAPYAHAITYAVINVDPDHVSQVNPSVPSVLSDIVARCMAKNRDERYATAAELEQALTDYMEPSTQTGANGSSSIGQVAQTPTVSEPPAVTVSNGAPSTRVRPKVVISYRRDVQPDQRVLDALMDSLSDTCDFFIDKMMPVGAPWVEQIHREINESDFFIVLLSEESVRSEMVVTEIELAHQRSLASGKPAILPVRVAHTRPFAYPLSSYVDHLNWAFWGSDDDTPRLIDDLKLAIRNGQLASGSHANVNVREASAEISIPEPLMAAQPVARLETPEGTMNPESAFYLKRPEDAVAMAAAGRQGSTLTIKGPRQMGKSSLLMKTMAKAADSGKSVVFLDFQLFDRNALADPDVFFRNFCAWVTDELDLDDDTEAYWSRPLGNTQRCTRYMSRHVLKTLDGPLFLAMDEVETMFDSPFRSDFFSMLRSWHNERAIKPIWRGLDLALVTSTEPYQLIENLNQSPFNVGDVVNLGDFTLEQVAELNKRHGSPVDADGVRRMVDLLGGHPYLNRKAFFLLSNDAMTMDRLEAEALEESGPFGDHLRNHLFRLHQSEPLVEGMRQILETKTVSDESIFWRLQGAGLVGREGRMIHPRCRLYGDYFRARLDAR